LRIFTILSVQLFLGTDIFRSAYLKTLCKIRMENNISTRSQVRKVPDSSIAARRFVAAQPELDKNLLAHSEVEADYTKKRITVRCSAAIKRAIDLQPSPDLPEWSLSVVID
jgi:hypothetical protein